MIILSIDSGIEKTGYAIFRYHKPNIKYITSGLIKTSSKKPIPLRLNEIYNELRKIIQKFHPTIMVVEQLFFFKNQKTIISVAQAQGITQLLAAQESIIIEFLTPLQIKQIITGYGTADKKSVEKMVLLSLPELKNLKKIDDEIDAIACGLAYSYLNKNLM